MTRYLSFVTVLCFASYAGATEWVTLGPRAMAMGGSGVAVTNGPSAEYWNPGMYGMPGNTSGFQMPVGAQLAVSGTVLQGANDLRNIQNDCQSLGVGNGTCKDANVQSALNELNNPNNGVRGDLSGMIGVKLGPLDIFADDFAYVGGKPLVDMTNNTAATVGSNQSALILRGINLTELGVGYGLELPLPILRGLYVGGNAKLMIGKVGYDQFPIIGNSIGSAPLDDFSKNERESVQVGFDAGALWDIQRTIEFVPWRPRVGIVARNINNPTFKNPDAATANGEPSRFSIQGNVRVGASLNPISFWQLVADADMTRNLSVLEGVPSQNVGAGTEIDVFNRPWLNIPLRAGLQKNIADRGSKTAITAGFGFNFVHVNFDVGGMVTPGTQSIQSQGESRKIPNEAGASFQLAILFGGYDADQTPAATPAPQK